MTKPGTVVQQCDNAFEAAFLKGYLDQHGIKAWADGEDSLRFSGKYAVIGKGVRVFVAPKDAARARKLIENVPSPEELPDEFFDEEPESELAGNGTSAEAPAAPVVCPNCGSAHIGRTGLPLLVRILLLGIPNLFHQPKWYCADCDWQWD